MQIIEKIKFFTVEELACPCCGLFNINPSSVSKLDILRERLSVPLKVNSACRCDKHNNEVGGATNSSHKCSVDTVSYAFDIAIPDGHLRYQLIKIALDLGFHRIGIYKDFVHIDDNPMRRPYIWVG